MPPLALDGCSVTIPDLLVLAPRTPRHQAVIRAYVAENGKRTLDPGAQHTKGYLPSVCTHDCAALQVSEVEPETPLPYPVRKNAFRVMITAIHL